MPAVCGVLKPGGQLVVLIKPQFEAGRHQVGSGGVVRDARVRSAEVLCPGEASYTVCHHTSADRYCCLYGVAHSLEHAQLGPHSHASPCMRGRCWQIDNA